MKRRRAPATSQTGGIADGSSQLPSSESLGGVGDTAEHGKVDRRTFLTAVGAGIATTASSSSRVVSVQTRRPVDVVVVGAGTFGMWTALHLQRLGARVTVVDAYGAANSRQTSGGETRGVRTSYGDRPHGRQWTGWAVRAIDRWKLWDEEARDRLLPQLFFQTGDLILREEVSSYITNTRANWDELNISYERLSPDEVTSRWPWIRYDNLGVALHEPGAGVVRARRAIESVARVFRDEGGEVLVDRATLGRRRGTTLENILLSSRDALEADMFVFACGPWFPKVFPTLMGRRLRISMGHVFYFAVPAGDSRFAYPNMPSFGVPGCTGWPALPLDHRGFRVRTGGRPPDDPDTSDRWVAQEYHERPREVLQQHFPDLVGAPINETRACHYESSVDSNFFIDTHPELSNVWLAGGGSAEGFKFGPVLGEYIANRLVGGDQEPELAAAFRLKPEQFGDGGAR